MIHLKVLVVVNCSRDEINMISCVRKEEGREVIIAETGEKALEILRNGTKDIERCDDKYNNDIHMRIIKQVKKMLGKDCRLTLKEIGRKLHLDPKYISKLFSRKGKEKFSSYRAKEKLKKAKEYLLKNRSIEITTDMVGFKKRQSLYDLFKKYEGRSPGKWLKGQLKKEIRVGEYSQEVNKTC